MNISIIDIGTQSIKHYIFTVKDGHKEVLHYKRYSEANLGESATISRTTTERVLKILGECLATNKVHGVSKVKVLGTDILRKAGNAHEFTTTVNELMGYELQIISQDLEAQYLYEGFIDVVHDDLHFAAVNIGGGSTELVIGNKRHLINSIQLPFGVKFLRQSFMKEDVMDWNALDTYLVGEIHINDQPATIFVTGVLDFISTVGPHIGLTFEKCDILNHPIQMTFEAYFSALQVLREIPIDRLRQLYVKDPTYADTFAIGQSVYVAIARKLSATTIIPSNNDLTDGVIHEMIQS